MICLLVDFLEMRNYTRLELAQVKLDDLSSEELSTRSMQEKDKLADQNHQIAWATESITYALAL